MIFSGANQETPTSLIARAGLVELYFRECFGQIVAFAEGPTAATGEPGGGRAVTRWMPCIMRSGTIRGRTDLPQFDLFLDRRAWSSAIITIEAESLEEAWQLYYEGKLPGCLEGVTWREDDVEVTLVDIEQCEGSLPRDPSPGVGFT